jgi:hypothetical protein
MKAAVVREFNQPLSCRVAVDRSSRDLERLHPDRGLRARALRFRDHTHPVV